LTECEWLRSHDVLIFWQKLKISVRISKTVQDGDIHLKSQFCVQMNVLIVCRWTECVNCRLLLPCGECLTYREQLRVKETMCNKLYHVVCANKSLSGVTCFHILYLRHHSKTVPEPYCIGVCPSVSAW